MVGVAGQLKIAVCKKKIQIKIYSGLIWIKWLTYHQHFKLMEFS